MNRTAPPAAPVVDLVAIAAAAGACVAWYDRHLAGHQPPWTDLAYALDRLRAAGPIPGRLGDAAAFLLDPPPGATTAELVDAIARLRSATRIVSTDPPPAPLVVRRVRGGQLALDLPDHG